MLISHTTSAGLVVAIVLNLKNKALELLLNVQSNALSTWDDHYPALFDWSLKNVMRKEENIVTAQL